MFESPTMLLLKATLLLAVALTAASLWRARSASRRHMLWSTAFVALLTLPPLASVVPETQVTVPFAPAVPESDAEVSAPADASLASESTAMDTSLLSESPILRVTQQAPDPKDVSALTRWRRPTLSQVVIGVWFAGVAVSLLALLIALARVRLVASRAEELKDAAWRLAAERLARQFGVRGRVRVLASSAIATPMAGGIIQPTVFVPKDATAWEPEVRDIVLAHEIAHLASRDPLRHIVSRVALSLYWMHPLAWLAARRSAVACEEACDEAVLSVGVRPSTYANVLLDFADATPLRLSAALPIVRKSLLESRLMAILAHSARPTRRSHPVVIAAGAIVLTSCLASVQPSAPAPAVKSSSAQPAVSAKAAAKNAIIANAPVVETAIISNAPIGESAVITNAPLAESSVITSVAPVEEAMSRAEEIECWSRDTRGRSFRGSMSTSERGGSTYISQRIGRSDGDWIIQKTYDDLRVCALGLDMDTDRDAMPSEWTRFANTVVLETQTRGGDVRHMEIAGNQATYSVNGTARPIDAAATTWRDALFAVLDDTWRLSNLRGRVSSLRGEISSIYGQRSSLLGEISSLRGQVSSMRGEISSWRGQESSMRGEISSIRGHESSLRGEISSARGSISSLEAARWDASDAERERIRSRVRQQEQRIARIEEEIRNYNADARVRAVEARIASTNFDAEVARIERRLRDFDVESKVKAVEREIAELEVEKQVAAIEKDIDALKVDENTRNLESRIDASLRRLRATLR